MEKARNKFALFIKGPGGFRNFLYRPSLKGDLNSIVERERDKIGKELDRQLEEIIELEKIGEIDMSKSDPDQVQTWLDQYITSTRKSPNSQI